MTLLSPAAFGPATYGSSAQVVDCVRRMKRAAIERDQRMATIKLVRDGKPELLFADLFSETWQKPVVANFIDTVAREYAEMIAPLPALNCASGAMRTDADKRRAGLRNKIGTHYWRESNLKAFMFNLADGFGSYGFAVFRAEPDYGRGMPMIRTMPAVGSYYENDRHGRTLRFAHCYQDTVDKVATHFPEHAPLIRSKVDEFGHRTVCAGDEKLEVVEYIDDQQTVLFLPDRGNLTLVAYPNRTGRCPVRVAERPGLSADPVGAYDQIIWVQLARHRMALLGLEAGVKAVGAPIALPRDVSELAVGPDSVIVSESPEKIRRVGIEVPASTFALQGVLEAELRLGARYPEGRASGMDASVITGQGVRALQASFDAQISTAQAVLGDALARVTEMAFEIDAKVWPHQRKRITGVAGGEPYDITYTPAKDIGESFACEVSYGFASGLSPNAAVVMLLQLRSDGLIDRDTVRRNMPFSIDTEQMQRAMDTEEIADALKQGLGGLLAGLGPLAAQGQDPRPFLRTAAKIIQGRRNGRDLADLFIEAFAPEVMDPEAAAAEAEAAEAEAAGLEPDPQGMPPPDPMAALLGGGGGGPAGPGGAPDLMGLLAGLRGGGGGGGGGADSGGMPAGVMG